MKEKTFTKAAIYNTWKKTGLIPFNPKIVLDKIWEYQNIQDTHPTTPLSVSILDFILDCIPQSAKGIINQRMILHRRILAGKKVNPKYLSQFIKGSISSAHLRQIVEDELKSVKRHATPKAERKKLIGTVAKKSGVITIRDVKFFFWTGRKVNYKKRRLLHKEL